MTDQAIRPTVEAHMFNLDPPLGFVGFDPHKEVTTYRRNLPHWRQAGATYFVTFRLADALPQSKLYELQQLREESESKPENERNDATRELTRLTEKWLDQGLGSCLLRKPEIRQTVCDGIRKFDGNYYELGAFVVMPNHVHLIIRSLGEHALEVILQGRKKWTSRQINDALKQRGTVWQEESHDRIIRDPEHLWRCLQYIGKNPRLAGIDHKESTRWVKQEWADLRWDFAE